DAAEVPLARDLTAGGVGERRRRLLGDARPGGAVGRDGAEAQDDRLGAHVTGSSDDGYKDGDVAGNGGHRLSACRPCGRDNRRASRRRARPSPAVTASPPCPARRAPRPRTPPAARPPPAAPAAPAWRTARSTVIRPSVASSPGCAPAAWPPRS